MVLRGMGYMTQQQHEAAPTVRKQRKVNIDAQVTSSILLYLHHGMMPLTVSDLVCILLL